MPSNNQTDSARTMVLFILVLPVIAYILYFAYKKNSESEKRAQSCQEMCETQNRSGYSFKWNILSGPQCECIEY